MGACLAKPAVVGEGADAAGGGGDRKSLATQSVAEVRDVVLRGRPRRRKPQNMPPPPTHHAAASAPIPPPPPPLTPTITQPEIAPRNGRRPSVLARPLLGGFEASDVTERYAVGHVLGRGAYATTRVCVHRETGQQVRAAAGGGGRCGEMRGGRERKTGRTRSALPALLAYPARGRAHRARAARRKLPTRHHDHHTTATHPKTV